MIRRRRVHVVLVEYGQRQQSRRRADLNTIASMTTQSQTADSAPGVATWKVTSSARKEAPCVRWTATGITHTHTHTRLTALCPGLPRSAGTRKVKPVWILLKQQTVSGSGISSAICKSAPCCRQKTTPATNHSVFFRPDALPATQPTASKH